VELKGAPGSCNYTRITPAMGFYTPLQQARFQLDDAFNRLDKFADADVPKLGFWGRMAIKFHQFFGKA